MATSARQPLPQVTAIHDTGYLRYDGPRHGRGYVFRTLFAAGLRTVFGVGRGVGAKLFPWSVVAVVAAAAAVVAVLTAQSSEEVVTYPEFVDYLGLVVALFLAIAAPELISRDMRTRVLSLYFSRPVRRTDYILAKLGALVAATWLLLGAPQLLMFAGAAFDAAGPREVGQELVQAGAGILYAAMFALVSAGIALLVASASGRRGVAAAGIAAVFLLTIPIAGVLSVSNVDPLPQLAGLVSPSLLLQGIHRWLFEAGYGLDIAGFGPLYAAVAALTVLACTTLLMVRVRRLGC